MSGAARRGVALRSAVGGTLGRPLHFLPVAAAAAVLLAVALLAAGVALRLADLEEPAWMRAQALVLVAGAEGETDLGAVGSALRRLPGVAAADFVSRDVALADIAKRRPLAAQALSDLRPNPLPDAFSVRFDRGADPSAVQAAVEQMGHVRNVERVEYAAEPYRRLQALRRLLPRVGALAAAVLAAGLVLALAIGVTVWTRVDHEEARVLTLLGAEPSALRRPVVYAATLQALLTGAAAWALALQAQAYVEPLLAEAAAAFGLAWPPLVLPPWAGVVFVGVVAVVAAALASLCARMALRAIKL